MIKNSLISFLKVFGYIASVVGIFILWTMIFASVAWFFGSPWVPPRQWDEVWLLMAPITGAFTAFTMAAIHDLLINK